MLYRNRNLALACLLFAGIAGSSLTCTEENGTLSARDETWTFVSMPDFLNADTTYPQPGWEQTLSYVLQAVKAENPDFLLVPGDLVMGRWWSEEKIKKYAAIYYPFWIERMEAHGLKFYAAIGDHEVGDNPWPPEQAKLMPAFKRAFRDHMKMPLNGPEHMKGTAFYFVHNNTLFVSVDVFEEGTSEQGNMAIQVTGKQLQWCEETVDKHPNVDHVIVIGHTPVLGPVRNNSPTALMLDKGRESPFWQAMVKHKVDLYLCGEMHAITSIEKDGIQQIVHGGFGGSVTKANYLVAKVSSKTIELELKQLDIINKGEKLWQEGKNGPREEVIVSEEIRKRGYATVGSMIIDKTFYGKFAKNKSGYFDKIYRADETLLTVYVVPDLPITQDLEPTTLYYKDLQPTNAETLPKFKRPPIVTLQQPGNDRLYISENTKDFVELSLNADEVDVSEQHPVSTTLWIVER